MAATKKTRKSSKAPKVSKPARDLYTEITERVIEAMGADGVAPWHKPWKSDVRGSLLPRNAAGRPYRGINVFLTWMTAELRGYSLPIWLTFKQANEIAAKGHRAAGRKVEQNEKGRWVFADGEDKGRSCGGVREGQNAKEGCGATDVILWKPMKREEEDSKTGKKTMRRWMMMRTFKVFNVQQCDEIVQAYIIARENEALKESVAPTPIEAAETICDGFDCPTIHEGDRAFYSPLLDQITLPPRHVFKTPENYYCVRFHEMGHASGHHSRLNRDGITKFNGFGSHEYSEEELVAEFTACFLAAEAGIERVTEGTSVAYLKHWAAKLKEDPKLVVHAAQRAQKAADFILGRKAPGETETSEEEAAA